MPVKRSYSNVTPGGSGRAKKRARTTKYNNGVASSSLLSADHKILSASKIVTMRYSDQFSIDATAAGTPGTYIFSANGLHDPNITGTGHQPRGYDQLMAMYRHYEVLEALIEVWADPSDSTAAGLLTLSVRSSNTPVALRDDMIEHRTAITKAMAPSGGGPGVIYTKIAVKPSQFLGLKSDDTVRGAEGFNPASPVYFHVNTMRLAGGDQDEVFCQARITYKVKLSEPKEPVRS
uniref:Capsid protein n=1 Tax=uncultured marine virus TaxID=186617 RepID=S4TEJ8_9VIRU|nr:hypothetical protein [uncultured marine virus]